MTTFRRVKTPQTNMSIQFSRKKVEEFDSNKAIPYIKLMN